MARPESINPQRLRPAIIPPTTRCLPSLKWRDLGDFHWVLALMQNKVPMAICPHFTSAFTDTGENVNLKPNAIREKQEPVAMTPGWVRTLKPVWIVHHRLRRLAAGHFSLKPTSYSIYTQQNPEQRMHFDVPKPTVVWWNRLGVLIFREFQSDVFP